MLLTYYYKDSNFTIERSQFNKRETKKKSRNRNGRFHSLGTDKTEDSDKSNRIWKESNLTDETLHELYRINREVSPSTDSSLGLVSKSTRMIMLKCAGVVYKSANNAESARMIVL